MADPEKRSKAGESVVLGLATSFVILRVRRYRRNLLFILTLLVLLMSFGGAVLFIEPLMARPVIFTVYWAVCFGLVFLILMLAIYDLMRVRVEGQKSMREMETKLEGIKAEALEAAARVKREQEKAARNGNEPQPRPNPSGESGRE